MSISYADRSRIPSWVTLGIGDLASQCRFWTVSPLVASAISLRDHLQMSSDLGFASATPCLYVADNYQS